MKLVTNRNVAALITLISAINVPVSFAANEQMGGHGGGNGGDPNELAEFTGANGEHLQSWYEVKLDLIHGIEMGKYHELDLGKIDPDNFGTDVTQVLRTVKVEFDDKEITVGGISRPCENFVDTDANKTKHIHCNSKAYSSAMINYTSETQYKMISHEYFSVAGFEPNEYGVSAYPISSQISMSLKTVTIKKWAVTPKNLKIETGCEIAINRGWHIFSPLFRINHQSVDLLNEKGYKLVSKHNADILISGEISKSEWTHPLGEGDTSGYIDDITTYEAHAEVRSTGFSIQILNVERRYLYGNHYWVTGVQFPLPATPDPLRSEMENRLNKASSNAEYMSIKAEMDATHFNDIPVRSMIDVAIEQLPTCESMYK